MALTVGCRSGAESRQESALYKRYASRIDMTVAQVCDFKLCDTVTVDVVLLEADNDEAWQRMVTEFGICDTAGVTSWLGDIDEPAQRTTWDGAPVFRVIASHDKHAIGFYKLENETQYNALLDYQLNKIK